MSKPIFPAATRTVEGMWWKQEPNVAASVALSNLSSGPTQAIVRTTDELGKSIAEHKVTISPHGTKTTQLRELQTVGSAKGGVSINSSETTDRLVVNGLLQDPAVGYSATMPFAFAPVDSSESPKPTTVAELDLMTGAADPMMLFPAGTTFTPYSVVRNVSGEPISLTPTLWWMEAGAPRSAQLSPLKLQPYETLSLDAKSLLSSLGPKNFSGSFNLVFEGLVRPGALVMSSGSVDQTNNYVFEVVARGVTESGAKSLQQWSTANGDDTMVTVWNPSDEAQDFAFTLFFTGGHFAVPLHLDPRVTRSFDVSEILRNQVPDAEGNVVPAGITGGTIKIAGIQAENEHILVGIDSGI